MNLRNVNRVYLLGIGGIGMSALARYFKANGAQVSGYDKTPSPLIDELIGEGIPVHFEKDVDHVPSADLYIYTPAIPKTHPAFDFVRMNGASWYKRSEVLQWITDQAKTIAIAGTHGKTTTTALTAHLLHTANLPIAAFVGGVMSGYESNVILNEKNDWVVVEADEYDRSFLRLKPEFLVVTSLDPDHLDIYGTFEEMIADYQKLVDAANLVWLHESVTQYLHHPLAKVYGEGADADLRMSGCRVEGGETVFELGGVTYTMHLPGRHNALNATAALAISKELDVHDGGLGLASFEGIRRRYQRVFQSANRVVYDDYAHHPKEITSAIETAQMLHPDHRLLVVFQPHLFSRTRDLEDDFASSLCLADELILLPIYPARELPIEGVSSEHLLNKVSLKTKQLVQKADLLNAVISLTAQTVLMLGAGDIDRLVQPLVNRLKEEEELK